MKLAIIGSRAFNDYDFLKNNILKNIKLEEIITIVSGGAKGADSLGKQFAIEFKKEYIEYLPDWGKYGRAAGVKRNTFIIEESDLIIAFWNGESKGTKDSINKAKKLKKKIIIISTND